MNGSNEANSLLDGFSDYVEEIKDLLSMDIWNNVFLNCSKNEVMILWLLYRKNEVNMSEIAEYIHAPLNTATGIIGRMEKSDMVSRTRSKEDKRVVLITFSENGKLRFQQLMQQLMHYGVKIMGALSKDEIRAVESVMAKVKTVLQDEKKQEAKKSKVRKITIE
ncbi:MAG: MarR family transcriptional regulator [Lachnospiraceae bacterium]|nr:MarR family transcriptional regulator [Lachnospiraceae bacterium]